MGVRTSFLFGVSDSSLLPIAAFFSVHWCFRQCKCYSGLKAVAMCGDLEKAGSSLELSSFRLICIQRSSMALKKNRVFNLSSVFSLLRRK